MITWPPSASARAAADSGIRCHVTGIRPRAHAAACLRGEIVEGFSLVVYEGGSVAELDACAEEAGFAALYVLDDGVWVSYLLSAPEFANRDFRELFTDGLPVATPLVGKSN